jgi:hypothetical protein
MQDKGIALHIVTLYAVYGPKAFHYGRLSQKLTKYKCCFIFNWGGIKPQLTPDKEVWPNPISVSMDD